MGRNHTKYAWAETTCSHHVRSFTANHRKGLNNDHADKDRAGKLKEQPFSSAGAMITETHKCCKKFSDYLLTNEFTMATMSWRPAPGFIQKLAETPLRSSKDQPRGHRKEAADQNTATTSKSGHMVQEKQGWKKMGVERAATVEESLQNLEERRTDARNN